MNNDLVSAALTAVLLYFLLSFIYILITSRPIYHAKKPAKKSLKALYTLYLSTLLAFALWFLFLIFNIHQTYYYATMIGFTVLALLVLIFSISILKLDKSDDNGSSKKIRFAFIIINLVIGLYYVYLVGIGSKYEFLKCTNDDDPLFCIYELFGPNLAKYDFKPDNETKFIRNCGFNLPNINNELLSKKIASSINNTYMTSEERNRILLNATDNGSKQEYRNSVCKQFYNVMNERKTNARLVALSYSSQPTN